MKIIKFKHVKDNNQHLKECVVIIQAFNIKNKQDISQNNQLGA
jgi:hypothetical protein